ALALLTLAACSVLSPTSTPVPAFYSLDSAPLTAPAPASPAAPTLIIHPPRAAAGFDSQRIIYVRESHKLEYFAHSEWIDPPARMLGPLLVAAIEQTGAFSAVLLTPGAAGGDLRLDTEIVRLQQEFQTSPSRVRFTLRAYLVDEKTRRVLAWRQFEAAADAASDDPYSGVLAANRAVQAVLQQLSVFCAEAVASATLAK
ncbi:ABC-type transport auxiliary lipoprotein family protein, partial [Rhodoferax sp.]|uniref:ABC-type transport auxiliary lipoprotein family protein n=1 Tax=Rhodoferax sp. TaxID=50421 RepID=UPI00374D87E0